MERNFEEIRDSEDRWNSGLKRYIKLKHMSDDWIQATLDYFTARRKAAHPTFQIFLEEKLYRAEKELYITDLDMITKVITKS